VLVPDGVPSPFFGGFSIGSSEMGFFSGFNGLCSFGSKGIAGVLFGGVSPFFSGFLCGFFGIFGSGK